MSINALAFFFRWRDGRDRLGRSLQPEIDERVVAVHCGTVSLPPCPSVSVAIKIIDKTWNDCPNGSNPETLRCSAWHEPVRSA